MITNDYINIVSDPKQVKKIEKLLAHLKTESSELCEWDFKSDKPCNFKFKKIEI